jgi:hypothetical protein
VFHGALDVRTANLIMSAEMENAGLRLMNKGWGREGIRISFGMNQ